MRSGDACRKVGEKGGDLGRNAKPQANKSLSEQQRQLKEELEKLRSAVRMTMKYGAVEDRRSGELKLRLPPKLKRSEVGL